MPRYRTIYRDGHIYFIAMDPDSAQVDHKYFKKKSKRRVSISPIDFCGGCPSVVGVVLRDGSSAHQFVVPRIWHPGKDTAASIDLLLL